MTGEMNQQRFKALLKETITLLCSNGLNFRSEFTIEAVIGITIDQESILLVSMQDTVTSNSKSISSPQQISDSRSLQADRIENEFTSTSNGMLKPHTDTHGAKNNQDYKHIGDIAAEAIPVLRKGEDFEPIRFGECTDGLNIKAEQTEDSFEWKSDNCLSSSRESVRSKSNFASDAISLSCTEIHNLDHLRKKASVSKGVRHLFGQTLAVEKQEEDFPSVDSVSRTLNNDLDTNRTMQAYTVEETIGSITSVGHPESEMTALSSVDHILRNTIGLPRVRSVRKSNVIQNVSQDVQPASRRSGKKSALSPYQCKICGKRIGTLHSLAVHEATVHLGKYRYSCPNCGKGYTVLSNLRAHIACKHNKQKEFVCGFCGREYGYKHSLKEHIQLVHNGNSAYK